MIKHFLLVVASILAILTGCNNNEPIPVYEDVRGIVLSDGEPVPNARIYIRSHFVPGGFIADTLDSVSISFNAVVNTIYTGSIYHYGSDSVKNVFFDDSLETGPQTLFIPDSLLTNGIFSYNIRNEFSDIVESLFLINKPNESLPDAVPFTFADTEGNFTLDSDFLALDRIFSTTGGGSFEITDSLQIIVADTTQVLSIDTVRVEPNQANFFEITLN